MRMTSIKQGIPSWAELSTTDEQAALAFYGQLFGWADDPRPMGEGMGDYHMQTLDGEMAAAIAMQQPMEKEQGIPPHWSVYLAVDNVDAVVAKVEGAEGQVFMPPMDVMESGRMAVIADPTGAAVGLWQAKAHQGFGIWGSQAR